MNKASLQKFLTHFISSFVLVFLFIHLNAQSDAVQKGHNGIETSIGQAFLPGKNPLLVNLSGSINGKLDLSVGIASLSPNTQYVFGSEIHFGGNPNDMGASLGAAYVVSKEVKNYFLLGPTVYANQNIGGILLIPTFGFHVATTEVFDFAGNIGLGFFTKGNVGLSIRPQFVFTTNDTYFTITIGLLAQS